MKRFITALSVAVFFAAFAPAVADAKRFGGGGMSGMQRSMPARTAPDAVPARPAAPAGAQNAVPGAGAAAATPSRSWMGPVAGLAAGLGIAALMSHLGMGAGFGNLITMLLIAVAAFVAFRFVMARLRPAAARSAGMAPQGMQFAGAGFGGQTPVERPVPMGSVGAAPSVTAALPVPAAGTSIPADFDRPGFERIAKMIFIRMQAANDAADLNDLRAFTTPEMFASVKLELQERGSHPNQTDVVQIDAQVLDFAVEGANQIVSVRFNGLIREELGGVAAPFDEVWHLVTPTDGTREWAIAGIQQTA